MAMTKPAGCLAQGIGICVLLVGLGMMARGDGGGGVVLGALLAAAGLWAMVAGGRPARTAIAAREAVAGETKRPMKKCPACAELILAEARKCRHCGEVVA